MSIKKIAALCLGAALVILISVFLSKIAVFHLKTFEKKNTANRILTKCENYRVSKTKDSTIYYTETDKNYVRLTERIIKTYYPLLKADIEYFGDKAVTVVIFPDKQAMPAAAGYGAESNILPMGAYVSGLILILSPSIWLETEGGSYVDAYMKTGPVFHELVHFVFDEKTKGNSKDWFSEGVALYYENKYGFKWEKEKNVRPVSFKELSNNFRFIDEKEGYRKSFSIVAFIAKEKGEAALRAVYKDLEQGNELDKTLKKLMGNAVNLFDNL